MKIAMMPCDAELLKDALRQLNNDGKIEVSPTKEKRIKFIICTQLQENEMLDEKNLYFASENHEDPAENYVNHDGAKKFREKWEDGPSQRSLEDIFREFVIPKSNFMARLQAH